MLLLISTIESIMKKKSQQRNNFKLNYYSKLINLNFFKLLKRFYTFYTMLDENICLKILEIAIFLEYVYYFYKKNIFETLNVKLISSKIWYFTLSWLASPSPKLKKN